MCDIRYGKSDALNFRTLVACQKDLGSEFVLMYFMYIMFMLCFCTLCSYATCEWPEFYVNKDMFCSVLTNSEDPDQTAQDLRCLLIQQVLCELPIFYLMTEHEKEKRV